MMADSRHCRSCGADVYWLKNETTGKPAPIDAVAVQNGNIAVLLHKFSYRVCSRAEVEAARATATPLYTNHFMTCPQSRTWKQSGYHSDKRKKQEAS